MQDGDALENGRHQVPGGAFAQAEFWLSFATLSRHDSCEVLETFSQVPDDGFLDDGPEAPRADADDECMAVLAHG